MAKSESPTPSEDAQGLRNLSSLAQQLEAAANDAEQASAAADAILAQLATLSDDAQNRVMANPLVQQLMARVVETEKPPSRNDPPGTIYYRTDPGGNKAAWSKKPWTWGDLYNPPPPMQPMPLKTFITSKRINLVWQGLEVTVNANEEVTLPEVFYGVWQDHLRNVKLAEQHAAYLMKKGAVPADPSIVTPDGARSRAIANHNGDVNIHQPGGGVIADWDPSLVEGDSAA